jgi:hypothetical protein
LRKFLPNHPGNLLQCEKHKLLMKSEHQKKDGERKGPSGETLGTVQRAIRQGQTTRNQVNEHTVWL